MIFNKGVLQKLLRFHPLLGKQKNAFCFSSQNNDKNSNKQNFGKPGYATQEKDQQFMKEQNFYIHNQNYNFEQYGGYTKNLNQIIKEKQDQLVSESNQNPIDRLPRRRRRVYDRPKYDFNMENYICWRSFERKILKPNDNALPIVCKITTQPRLIKKVFGEGKKAFRNNCATWEYDFEDGNYDLFLLYDYKETTRYWGENLLDYDYDNQDKIQPRSRKYRRPSIEEFWESDQPAIFRINSTRYADFRKFRKWFLNQIEQNKNNEESYDQMIRRKYGEIDTYDNFSKDYEIQQNLAYFQYDVSYFQDEKTQKSEKSEKQKQQEKAKQPDLSILKLEKKQKPKPAVRLSEEYRIKITDETENKI